MPEQLLHNLAVSPVDDGFEVTLTLTLNYEGEARNLAEVLYDLGWELEASALDGIADRLVEVNGDV